MSNIQKLSLGLCIHCLKPNDEAVICSRCKGLLKSVAKCNSSTLPTLSEGNFSNSCNAKG